jgi:hypothetical protein
VSKDEDGSLIRCCVIVLLEKERRQRSRPMRHNPGREETSE